MAMEPWEWDAWRAYWRARPRFDPWWAMAMVCSVVANALGAGKKLGVEDFYPKPAPAKSRPRRKRARSRGPTAAAFDRMMGI